MQVHGFKHVSRGNLQNILAWDLAKCKFSGCLCEKLSTRDTPLYPLSLHHSRAYPSHTATDLLLPHILPKSYLGTFCCPGEVNPEAKAASAEEVLRPHLTDLGFASQNVSSVLPPVGAGFVSITVLYCPDSPGDEQKQEETCFRSQTASSGYGLSYIFWFVVFFK